MKKKVIILHKLTAYTLIMATFSRLFNVDVYYLRIANYFRRMHFVKLLNEWNIMFLDFSECDESVARGYETESGKMARIIWNVLAEEGKRPGVWNELFDNISDFERKLMINCVERIDVYIRDLALMILWAKSFTKTHGKVHIYFDNNLLTRTILARPEYHFVNICPRPLFYLKIIFKSLFLAMQLLSKMVHKMANTAAKNAREEQATRTNPEGYEILFFPHEGTFYGKLFKKDFFYNENADSPFYKEKILHMEQWSNAVGHKELFQYYLDNNIPFALYSSNNYRMVLKILVQFITFLSRKRIGIRNAGELYLVFIVFYVYLKFKMNVYNLKNYKSARIALVGYDFLFSKDIALALSSLNIKTIALQERFIAFFRADVGLIMDYYFVCSDYYREVTKKNLLVWTYKTRVIGAYRLDLLHKYGRAVEETCEKYLRRKRQGQKIVLSLDFHSSPDVFEACSNVYANWRSNKSFYKDMIRLAIRFPDIYVVIRGKNDDWCEIPEFKEIYEMIQFVPNIEVNRDYDEFDVTYKIAAAADFLIARYTSMVDEFIASGKPALVCDYMPNGEKVFSGINDYENFPVYVYSYDELERNVGLILANGCHMDKEEFDRMRRYLYGDFFDGKVKERLHVELARIYLSCVENGVGIQ